MSDNEIASEFTTEELLLGIDQYAQVKLGMSGEDFIAVVRRGEPVHHLHEEAQGVADLVALLPKE